MYYLLSNVDQYKQELGVQFDDLNENDNPLGTKVTINMPFKQNY